MSEKEKKVTLEINADELIKALTEVDEKRKKIEEASKKTISFVKAESKITFGKVLQIAKTSWYIIDNLLQSMGSAVSAQFRLAINAAFSTIAIMRPIIAAEAVTPGMQIQAAIGMMQIGLALNAIQSAQAREAGMGEMFDTMHMLRGIDTLIGYLEFL